MPLVEMTDFNASKKQKQEKFVEIPINNDYKAGHLLDYSYHQICYKLSCIDLSICQVKQILLFLKKIILQQY